MTFQRHQAFLGKLGFGGVSIHENANAQLWSRRLEGPMILVALWIIIDWYLREKGLTVASINSFTDRFIWLCFIVETSVLYALVDNKKQYLLNNWMNILIILAGLPIIWGMETFYAGVLRSLRLLIMLGILLRISTDIRSILSRHHLGLTLFISFLMMLASGFIISGIDPAFKSPIDGIWWAWVTVTTVGYGDLVPSTTIGRLFGVILILMGIAIFSMLTASFSVFFIEQDEKEMLAREEDNIRRISRIESQLERIETQLQRTLSHLESTKSTSPLDSTGGDIEAPKNTTVNPYEESTLARHQDSGK